MCNIPHEIISILKVCNIRQVGKPTDDWKNDPEGVPESAMSKAVRGATKFATQVSNVEKMGLCVYIISIIEAHQLQCCFSVMHAC